MAKEAAEREMRILELKIRLQEGSQSTNVVTAGTETNPNVPFGNPQKLLPLFDERRDDLHAYLQRFERVATGQGWPQDKWAVGLSMCLSGEALTVIGRMTAEESLDYTKLKKVLLQRFRFTAQGYQEKFRKARAEDGETGRQFAARLSSYFDHWVEMANIPKTYEGLRDLVISEQFYGCCHPKLMVFLKERECANLGVLADVTDRFLEAQSLANLGSAPTDVPDIMRGAANTAGKGNTEVFLGDHPEQRAQVRRTVTKEHENCCKHGRPGGSSDNCRSGSEDQDKVIACAIYEPPKRVSKTKFHKDQMSRSTGRGSNYINTSARNSPFLVKGMPVVPGRVLGKFASVLRDTGSDTAIVRRDMVDENCLTGVTRRVVLLDGSVQEVPEAKIQVHTPYLVGEITAACMSRPIYDLILGNIPGVREPHHPDRDWEYEVAGDRETPKSSLGRTLRSEPCYLISAVARTERPQTTRSNVPPPSCTPYNRDRLPQEQRNDYTLRSCYRKVGRESRSARGHRYTFLESEGLLYRECQFAVGKAVKQMVVPKIFREFIIRAAHENITPRHAGIRKTGQRILDNFYWPDLQNDVKRFVRSCHICSQRTTDKLPLHTC
ncbi:uncharacterized protein LOC144180242 [Haemaphysalis longicornis]